MGEFGYAPNFRKAVENGAITILDATCPALYAELQASVSAEGGLVQMKWKGGDETWKPCTGYP